MNSYRGKLVAGQTGSSHFMGPRGNRSEILGLVKNRCEK